MGWAVSSKSHCWDTAEVQFYPETEAAQHKLCPLQDTMWAAQQHHLLSWNTPSRLLSRWAFQAPQLSCGNEVCMERTPRII